MEQVPILKIGRTLFVSIQIDLQDDTVLRLQEDLADELAATGASGVIIDNNRCSSACSRTRDWMKRVL